MRRRAALLLAGIASAVLRPSDGAAADAPTATQIVRVWPTVGSCRAQQAQKRLLSPGDYHLERAGYLSGAGLGGCFVGCEAFGTDDMDQPAQLHAAREHLREAVQNPRGLESWKRKDLL